MCRVCKLYNTSAQTEAYWANAVLSTVYDLMSARDIKVHFCPDVQAHRPAISVWM